MDIAGSVALVTGSNRGIGRRFAVQLLERGAAKVYATARRPELVDIPGVEVLPLDITDDASITAAAAAASDVTLLVNNAGIATTGSLVSDPLDDVRREMDTHFWGNLAMVRAFAPVIEHNGGGAIVNVLSVASWINRPLLGIYGATKSAAWGLTNSLRHELRGQGTQVLALHMGFVDTDLTRGIDAPKSTPQSIVERALDALESGAEEVLADEMTQQVKRGLVATPAVYLVAP